MASRYHQTSHCLATLPATMPAFNRLLYKISRYTKKFTTVDVKQIH